jgi:ribonucleoside-diphosphate reductase alpha chain
MQVNYNKNDRLSDQAKVLLKEYYCRANEDPQDAFARAASAFSGGDRELAQRIYNYASDGWFMFSSPVLSNAPIQGEPVKGMPISCFLSYVGDTLDSLIQHNAETAWLSVKGGGVGGHWSRVRAVSDKAPGPIPFMKVVDAQMTAYKQGKTRKGSYAAYLDVSHPDIIEFINFKMPSGDINRKCFNLFNAVNITDAFMELVLSDGDWQLIDPQTKVVRDTVKARELWESLLQVRYRTGSPYLNFIDEANRQLHPALIDKGLVIHGSNLCNEIHLPTSENRTAVCCLSSVNLEKFDDWQHTTMVQDLIRYLDNVLDFFIKNCPSEMGKAQFSAVMERSIGLGAMGFHGYLQGKGVAFESVSAQLINNSMFKHIKEEALVASRQLAIELGEAPDLKGHKVRNAHLLAIAPNANSSIICNCSASIEPIKSNAYTHRTRAGSHLIKNKHLEYALELTGTRIDEAMWQSIIAHQGSVQHLDIDEGVKEVFKTAFEINQHWVVEHCSNRQKYICQGQSVNLFFPDNADAGYVNSVHVRAWKHKLKGLYYLRTTAGHVADVGERVVREALKDADECLSCEG